MAILPYGVGDPVTADSLDTYLPLGAIARGRRQTPTGNITTTETGVLRIDGIPVLASHLYQIHTSNINLDGTVANDIFTVRIRVNTGGAAATTSSTQIAQLRQTSDDPTNSNILPENTFHVPTADTTLSVLLSAVRTSGTGNLVVFCSGTDILDMVVSDLGFDPGDTGVVL